MQTFPIIVDKKALQRLSQISTTQSQFESFKENLPPYQTNKNSNCENSENGISPVPYFPIILVEKKSYPIIPYENKS